MGIRTKLLLSLLLSAFPFLLFINGYLLPGIESHERARVETINALTLGSVSRLIAPHVENSDLESIGKVVNDYVSLDYGVAGVIVTGLNGNVLYSWRAEKNPAATNTLETRILEGGRHVGNIRLITDVDYHSGFVNPHLHAIGAALAIAFLLVLLVIFLVYDGLVRRPIKKLLKSVNSIAYGNFDAEIPVLSDDEVGELAASIKMMRGNMAAFQHSLREKTIKANDLAESLYESKHRMQSIINNVAHGIVVANNSGVIESVNRSLCEMLGYSEDELIGKNIEILIPDKYKQMHIDSLRRYQETGVSRVLGRGVNELEALAKNGKIIPVDIAITEMNIGESRYFNAVMTDVTERKQAEMKLRQERDRAQRYLDTVEVMVVALDCDGRINLINRKGGELVGHPEGELLGKKWADICVRLQDRELFESFFHDQLYKQDGFVDSSESTIISSDRDERIISWRYSQLLDENGAVGGLLCSGTDITSARKAERERESMQQQLQQSQKMQAIGQLTGGIAHDFNNIIASILGHTELLMIRMANNRDEKVDRYLENIYRSSERAKELVEKMLAFSRGRGKDVPAAIEVESAIQDIINILRSVLPATIGITVSSSGKGMGVLAAPVDLQQIVMNLCINARDAMDGHGNLDISVRGIHDAHGLYCSSCHQNFGGDYVVIAVADNGVGIAGEQLDRLFEPFFTTKEVGKGTGMGLSVVHGIVHDLGGHIVVDSAPGSGACFHVYLKSSTVVQGDKVCMGDSCGVVTGEGKVVLVVDDESLVREFVSELLTESGYSVLLAADPFEGLEVVKSKHQEIDAVITDQSMPGMTGIQMARIISNMYSTLPIVLSTGYGDDITEADLKAAGISSMLNKPMKGHELLSAIERSIGEERVSAVS